MTSYKMRKMNGQNWEPPRALFCEKCGTGFKDSEPFHSQGEFWHPTNPNKPCENSGKAFRMTPDGMDVDANAKMAKIKMFVRKRWRKYQ